MILLHPIWLLFALPLGASLWLWRMPSRFLLVLRAMLLLLVLLALSGPGLRLPGRAATIVVVADRSLSMPRDSDVLHKEAIDVLQAAMAPDERLAVVAFGATAAVERAPQAGPFAGFVYDVGRDASHLAEAVDTALALIPKDTPGKILVLSDGRWTGRDPAGAVFRAVERGIGIDYRPLQRTSANDLAIARIDAPATVGPGESFLITAWVHAPGPQDITYALRRGNQRLAQGTRSVVSGLNRLTFRDRASESGTQAYTLTVTGKGDDPVPENNTARLLVGVQGPRPILLVSPSGDSSGLARLLRAGGLKVHAVRPEHGAWSLEELSRHVAVLLENVPAEKIGQEGMETLATWVRVTGAGLMMTGGRSAYGPGGYFRSPLEPVLPVSMELRQEHRKLAMAIVVALDRSGSMAMPVGGGKVKMDLANLGTVQVLDLLGPADEFGVLAVDTAAHVIQELGPVRERERVRGDILRIQSMGGGIYVYEALDAATRMLARATVGTRHIILFADAADAEEPRNYQDLLEQCNRDNITVSVIGLGKETDKDGALLQDIARRGKGRCFFSDNPDELPRLFAQDTFIVARSSFLDELTPVRVTAGLTALAGKSFPRPPPIGGYNLCYLRPGANLAAVSVDEYEAPVVAAWQAGLGRVLCYTGEADGKYTGPFAQWDEAGAFFTTLARWTAGGNGNLPDNMLLTQEVKNGVLLVQLHLDPERQAEAFAGLPRVTTLRAAGNTKPRAETTTLQWTGADTLAVEIPLYGSETALATVDLPGSGPVALPPVCLPYSPEFKPAQGATGLAALERLARATGGKERIELAGIWAELPKPLRLVELGPWLLLAAVVLLLMEVLERRTGLLAGRIAWSRATGPGWISARRWKSGRASSSEETTPVKEVHAPARAVEQPMEGGLLEALRQARQRAQGGHKPPGGP
jgi:von Willebrand factor type A domain